MKLLIRDPSTDLRTILERPRIGPILAHQPLLFFSTKKRPLSSPWLFVCVHFNLLDLFCFCSGFLEPKKICSHRQATWETRKWLDFDPVLFELDYTPTCKYQNSTENVFLCYPKYPRVWGERALILEIAEWEAKMQGNEVVPKCTSCIREQGMKWKKPIQALPLNSCYRLCLNPCRVKCIVRIRSMCIFAATTTLCALSTFHKMCWAASPIRSFGLANAVHQPLQTFSSKNGSLGGLWERHP